MSEPECELCENGVGQNGIKQALVKVYSREEESSEIVQSGKRKVDRETRERWICLECLLTKTGSSALEQGLFRAGVEYE